MTCWKFPKRDEAMNVQKKLNRGANTDAVSPVIGVMLMIVVTVIIAAVVAAFAGGFAESQKKTPTVQIDVQLREDQDSSGTWYSQLIFTHKGGDPLPTHDLKIITWNNQSVEHVIDGSNVTSPRYPCKIVNGECLLTTEFGNSTWMNGDILATVNADSTSAILGFGSFSPGTTVSVDIVYAPTNELLFHRDVIAS
jgi:FlaG/FlaF family flagellin (archaellin)